MPDYRQFFIILAAGWINRDQRKIIDYLIEEIRVYQEHFKGRHLRFTRCAEASAGREGQSTWIEDARAVRSGLSRRIPRGVKKTHPSSKDAPKSGQLLDAGLKYFHRLQLQKSDQVLAPHGERSSKKNETFDNEQGIFLIRVDGDQFINLCHSETSKELLFAFFNQPYFSVWGDFMSPITTQLMFEPKYLQNDLFY